MLYNVSIAMVNLWSALASRDVRLLKNQIDKLNSLARKLLVRELFALP